MPRRWILPAVLLLSAAIPRTALADDAENCPPGGWFCEDLPPLEEAPEAQPTPRSAPPRTSPPARRAPVPPPPPPPPYLYRRPYVVEVPPPPPRRPRPRSELGLQVRFLGALMDGGKNPEAGMGGFGLSLRPRPSPYYAFDIGFDSLHGVDYNGNPRSEGALSFNPMFFLNPGDKTQVYLLTGLGFSGASVELPDGSHVSYAHMGVSAGIGLEFRLTRRFALDLDLLGFIRGRIDRDAHLEPEFVDLETGQTTNTSGGGLLRFGATFYW